MALRALLLCVVLALAGCGCGGGDGEADRTTTQPPRDPTLVAGGVTALELDAAITGLLDLAGVRIEPVAPARRQGAQLRFPITSGRLDLRGPSGTVEHGGALRVRAAGQTLEARRLVVDVARGEITGEVEGVRVPLFVLELAPVGAADADPAVVEGVVRTPEQSILEDRLGIPLPSGPVQVGELVVSAERP